MQENLKPQPQLQPDSPQSVLSESPCSPPYLSWDTSDDDIDLSFFDFLVCRTSQKKRSIGSRSHDDDDDDDAALDDLVARCSRASRSPNAVGADDNSRLIIECSVPALNGHSLEGQPLAESISPPSSGPGQPLAESISLPSSGPGQPLAAFISIPSSGPGQPVPQPTLSGDP